MSVRFKVLLTFMVLLGAITGGRAATFTWNQTAAATYSWITTSNWTATGTPNAIDDVANLNNNITGNQTVQLNQAITLGTLNIGDSNGTHTFTLAAGAAGSFLIMDSASGSAAINKASGANANDTISADILLNDTLVITNASTGTLTISGVIDDGAITYGITKAGTGTLILSGVNTYTGATTVSGGTLTLSVAGSLADASAVNITGSSAIFDISAITAASETIGSIAGVSGSSVVLGGKTLIAGGDNTSTTFAGIISGAGGSLTKSGTGTLTLSGANTYTGTTTINAGTITLDYTTVGSKLADTSILALGGGTLNLANGASAHNEVVASTTINSGASSVTRSSGTSVLRMNAITRNAGGTIDFGAASIADTDTSNTNGILGGWATVAGADWAISATGAANTAITALASYTAFGTSSATTNQEITSNGATSTSNNYYANSLKIAPTGSGGTLTLGGSNKTMGITSGGILFIGSNDYTILATNSNTELSGQSGGELIVQQFSTGTLIISAIIKDNGTTGLTKAGTGTLTLSGANTYTGATTVNAGTLEYGANNVISTGAVTVSGSTAVLSMLTFTDSVGTVTVDNGGSITGGSGGTLTSTGTFAMKSGSVSAILAGGVALNKTTAGTVTLSGANTYTGLTTISAGVLNIQNATALGTTAAGTSVTNGAALEIQGVITVGSEALTLNGTGVSSGGALRNISGDNTFGGLVTLGSATRINSDTAGTTLTLSNTGTITGATFGLTVGGVGNTSIASIIGTTSGTLTKDGIGTLTLSGANTYTGTTTVSGGTLSLDFSAAGAPVTNIINTTTNSSALSMGGGTLALTGKASTTNSQRFNGLTLTGGANSIQLTANVTANPLLLTLNAITRSVGSTADFTLPSGTQSATNGITTTNANDANGLLGVWATVNGTDFATVSANNIIAYTGYTDVTRLSSGTKAIANSATSNVRIIEGTGSAADITLAAATTTINTLNQSASGGTSAATIHPNNKTLAVNSILLGTGAGDLTIGTGTNNGTLKSAGTELIISNYSSTSTATINSVIADGTGASSLVKSGTGNLTLTATNTYTGVTAVNAGTLQIDGVVASAVTVNAGATLSGTGSVSKAITIKGVGALRPGQKAPASDIGTFTLSGAGADGDLTVVTTGTLGLQLGSNGIAFANQAGTFYTSPGVLNTAYVNAANIQANANDRIIVGGTLTLTLGSTVDVTTSSFTPSLGDGFDMLDWTTAFTLGTFNVGTTIRTGTVADNLLYDLKLPDITAVDSTYRWDTSLFASDGIVVVVPEPSRGILLMLGLAGCILRRRRAHFRVC